MQKFVALKLTHVGIRSFHHLQKTFVPKDSESVIIIAQGSDFLQFGKNQSQ